MNVKLEVGKKYRDHAGNIVEIVKKVENRIQPFLGDDYCYYTSEGWWSTKESKFDLIEEITESEPKGLTLKVGHKYLTREGDIVEILYDTGNSNLSLRGSNAYWYDQKGSTGCIATYHRDIVSEYTESAPKGKHFDDLTQIDVPFGELDESTQLRLKVAYYEGECLQYRWERETTWFKKGNKTSWINTTCYRVKPKPTTHKATVQVDLEGNILKDTVQLVED